MSKLSIKAIVFLVTLSAGLSVTYADPVINEVDAPKFLYTISANSGTFENGTLTLKDTPLVVYFSSRPAKVSGMLSLEVFSQGWDQGPNSFREDPPNGTLSILSKKGTIDAVLELSNPTADSVEGTISFKVKVLDGEVPKSFGDSTLFIDNALCPACMGQ